MVKIHTELLPPSGNTECKKLSFDEIVKEIEIDYDTTMFKDLSSVRTNTNFNKCAFFSNNLMLDVGSSGIKLMDNQYDIASLYFTMDDKYNYDKMKYDKILEEKDDSNYFFLEMGKNNENYVAYYLGPKTNNEKLTLYETEKFLKATAKDELEFYTLMTGGLTIFDGSYTKFRELCYSKFEKDFKHYLKIMQQ